jgi:phage-related tail fiber protein
VLGLSREWNGTVWVNRAGGIVTSVTATGPIVSSGGATPVISITAATDSAAGSMSAADKTKLDAATNLDTVGTLVQRDASGNFSAGSITAALLGNASTASDLQAAVAIALSGDATGSITFNGSTGITIPVTLKNTGTAGTYTKVTTDAQGRVTAGALLVATDIPTLTHLAISDFDAEVRLSRLDQMAAPTASVSMNSQSIINLANPVNPQDAVTKYYADNLKAGLSAKAPVQCATAGTVLPAYTVSGNVLTASANGVLTIDGYTLLLGDRIIVKDETVAANNGWYSITQLLVLHHCLGYLLALLTLIIILEVNYMMVAIPGLIMVQLMLILVGL